MVKTGPEAVTCVAETAIVSTTELSEVFLIVILPVPLAMASLKVILKEPGAALEALAAGEVLETKGAVLSTVKSVRL